MSILEELNLIVMSAGLPVETGVFTRMIFTVVGPGTVPRASRSWKPSEVPMTCKPQSASRMTRRIAVTALPAWANWPGGTDTTRK